MEHLLSTHPLTTHVVAALLGGPLFGLIVNMVIAKIFGAGSKASRVASTWLSTLPSLIQAAEATGAPGLSKDEHLARAMNLVDAAAASLKLAADAAAKPPTPPVGQ